MKFVILLIALLASFSLVTAFPVDISYTDSSSDGKPIVADVPFEVTVMMNTNDNDVLSYNLYVTSDDARMQFTSATRRMLFSSNDLSPNSGSQSAGTIYRYQVQPKVGYVGRSFLAQSLFTLKTILEGPAPSSVQLKREGDLIHSDNIITPAATGARVEAINDAVMMITPVLSVCGDGIVGYFDADTDGIKDAEETEEKCDGGMGCNRCQYIEIGYRGTNCGFGSRNCQIEQLSPVELLREKLNALLSGECYPADHPDPLYCGENSINYGDFVPREKSKFLGHLVAALNQFFRDSVID